MSTMLWNSSDTTLNEKIMAFLSGEDVVLDQKIFLFDIQGTQAHIKGLASIGVIEQSEYEALNRALIQLVSDFQSGAFVLDAQFEDGHSAIEYYLTEQLPEIGGKVHTGRSRNDQVLVATRLYLVDAATQLQEACSQIAHTSLEKAKQTEKLVMPGYTHLQRAVVSSIGMWMAGVSEAFIDNLRLAKQTGSWVSANPLGTAAGYGVNLALDRELTTRELNFERMQINPIYAQNSRGKFELQLLSAIGQALLDVRRFAWDLSLYTTTEFNFVSLPSEYTTGSSIMPNKRNPDVVELLRAAYSVVNGAISELTSLLSLPSGYHRDLQGTKAPLLRGVEHGLAALALVPDLIEQMSFNQAALEAAFDKGMFATDMAVELSAKNIPFRQAYRIVKESLDDITSFSPQQSLEQRTSAGAGFNLMLDELENRLKQYR